jgi:hypothetical protein
MGLFDKAKQSAAACEPGIPARRERANYRGNNNY